jgi:pyruvate/2-oxoglutarate dehydrogenase complex dihydrolipoamide dehydrogenase (E3) component
VNLRNQRPGKRALIVGSELIALSSVLTLKRAGASIGGMVEEGPRLQTHPALAAAMGLLYGFPIYRGTSVKSILGDRRVEALELVRHADQEAFEVECDTLVITGKFLPESALIHHTPIKRDPMTSGPQVDQEFMTSVPHIFAAGNVLRGADMHDLCALEGKKAAKSILKRAGSSVPQIEEAIRLRVEPPIRYVVPQKIVPDRKKMHRLSWLDSQFSMQTDSTLTGSVVEAWSGDEKIWNGSFSRLIPRKRYSLPVDKFDWNRVDQAKDITLRLRDSGT